MSAERPRRPVTADTAAAQKFGAVHSMTGFARVEGALPRCRFAWELKTVNAKGLDVRLRVPAGQDAIEAEARTLLAKHLGRGTCLATLTVDRDPSAASATINVDLLATLLDAVRSLPAASDLRPASLDALLAVPGVIVTDRREDRDEISGDLHVAVLEALSQTIAALIAARRGEGESIARVLAARLATILDLTQAAAISPARRPEAIRARLALLVASLLEPNAALDPARLHQEAVFLAVKADVQEELDRLTTHAGAALQLLRQGGPVGRRLDFLAQEFTREANTLCAKANDASLTAIGLDLKTEIEQFREQVQNLE